MKPMEAITLRDALLEEANADDRSMLSIICYRLAIGLDHYAHLKLKKAVSDSLNKSKKKRKQLAWIKVEDNRDIGLTMSKKRKKK